MLSLRALSGWTALIGFLAIPAQATPAITDPGQGLVSFASGQVGELSGITYVGGDQYLLVSDNSSVLAHATITIDAATGQITGSPTIDSTTTLLGGSDLEGIAYDPRDASILASDEASHTLMRFNPTTGALLGSVDVPAVYLNARGNRSLESLSMDRAGYRLWTANEEALADDGDTSTDAAGTYVRLQQFDADGLASAQYAYLTDPHTGTDNFAGLAQSGVADVLALPTGELIVMERELGGNGFLPDFRIRLYLIDTAGATDTAAITALGAGGFTPAAKTLLDEFDTSFSNIEGIALGPMLNNGDYALIMVSDDGATFNEQNLITRRLSGVGLVGDLNGDWAVDAADLTLVMAHWGNAVTAGDLTQGDVTGDGQVGVSDLDAVLGNWTDGQAPSADVPEPASAASLSALLGLTLRRRG